MDTPAVPFGEEEEGEVMMKRLDGSRGSTGSGYFEIFTAGGAREEKS